MAPTAGPSPSPMVVKEKIIDDDGWTVYSDDDSSYQSPNDSTVSFASYRSNDELPPFRLSKADGHQKEVYEAWTISNNYLMPISTRKICGIPVVEDYDNHATSTVSELYSQETLKDMVVKAVSNYNTEHKRTWPSHFFRGKCRSYEDDIDSRIRKLGTSVQSEISDLLADREDSTRSRFHNRVWTVVMMQEQLRHRFAGASPTVVEKRHKLRRWKNPPEDQPLECFIIIRGREGRPVTDANGQAEFQRYKNPWKYADQAELRQKNRERLDKWSEKRAKDAPPPSYPSSRTPPPPPPPPPAGFPLPAPYNNPGNYVRPQVGVPYHPTMCPPPGPPGVSASYFGPTYPPPPPPPHNNFRAPGPGQHAPGLGSCPATGPVAPAGIAPAVYPNRLSVNGGFNPAQRMSYGGCPGNWSYNAPPAPAQGQSQLQAPYGTFPGGPRPGGPGQVLPGAVPTFPGMLGRMNGGQPPPPPPPAPLSGRKSFEGPTRPLVIPGGMNLRDYQMQLMLLEQQSIKCMERAKSADGLMGPGPPPSQPGGMGRPGWVECPSIPPGGAKPNPRVIVDYSSDDGKTDLESVALSASSASEDRKGEASTGKSLEKQAGREAVDDSEDKKSEAPGKSIDHRRRFRLWQEQNARRLMMARQQMEKKDDAGD